MVELEDCDEDGIPRIVKVQMQIWLWFLFFRENIAYKEYCDAKRAKNNEKCLELEGKHGKIIAELFADWEDIHAVDLADTFNRQSLIDICRDDPESFLYSADDLYTFDEVPQWVEWFNNRRHLFVVPKDTVYSVSPVADSPLRKPKDGHILLEVPLLQDKAATIKLIAAELERQYQAAGQRYADAPKYQFAVPRTQDATSALARPARAYLVHLNTMALKSAQGMNKQEIAEWMLAHQAQFFSEAPSEDGATDDGEAFDGAADEGLFAGLRHNKDSASFIKTAQRYRREFDTLVHHTISGKFPCLDRSYLKPTSPLATTGTAWIHRIRK